MASSEKKNISLKGLLLRRIPQFIGLYLGASWGILQFVDWLVRRYILSTYLTDFAFVTLLSLLPTIVLLAWFHGTPGQDRWTQVEKVAIPVNFIITAILLFLLFRGKDLGATAHRVTVEDEDGKKIERLIPKNQFIKKVGIFFFENSSPDKTLDYLQYGLSSLISLDLSQDMFFDIWNGYAFVSKMKQAGFSHGLNAPLTLQLKLALNVHLDYVLTGSFSKQGQKYIIQTTLYHTKSGKSLAQNTFEGQDILHIIDEIALRMKYDLELSAQYIQTVRDLPVAEIFTKSPEAGRLLILGSNEYLIENDMKKAIRLCEQAIQKDPIFALSYFYLFIAYANANQTEKMEKPLKAVMQYSYKLPESLRFQLKSIYYFIKGQPEKQLAVLKMWVELYPNNIEAHNALAQYYTNSKQPDLQITEHREILRIDPQQLFKLLDIGDIYRHTGQHDSAFHYYRRYAALFPNESRSWSKFAYLFTLQGDYEKAKFNHQKAQLIDPTDISISLDIGRLERYFGNFDEALDLYQQALEASQAPILKAEAYVHLENYYEQRGQIRKSIEYMHRRWEERAKYQKPLSVMINKILELEKYTKIHQPERAFQVIEKANLLPPFDKFKPAALISIYLALEDIENAKKLIEPVRQIERETGFGFTRHFVPYAMARIDEIEGKYKQALLNYQKTIQLKPQQSQAKIDLGRCYRKMKNYKKAAETLLLALKKIPYAPEANYEIALVYLESGETEKALKHLKIAREVLQDADPDFDLAQQVKEKLAELQL